VVLVVEELVLVVVLVVEDEDEDEDDDEEVVAPKSPYGSNLLPHESFPSEHIVLLQGT